MIPEQSVIYSDIATDRLSRRRRASLLAPCVALGVLWGWSILWMKSCTSWQPLLVGNKEKHCK